MWKITKDNQYQELDDIKLGLKDRSGVRTKNFDESLATEKFRMLDDDGIVCYEGIADKNTGFEPLHNFGTPDSGCTEIQYLVNGKWETL